MIPVSLSVGFWAGTKIFFYSSSKVCQLEILKANRLNLQDLWDRNKKHVEIYPWSTINGAGCPPGGLLEALPSHRSHSELLHPALLNFWRVLGHLTYMPRCGDPAISMALEMEFHSFSLNGRIIHVQSQSSLHTGFKGTSRYGGILPPYGKFCLSRGSMSQCDKFPNCLQIGHIPGFWSFTGFWFRPKIIQLSTTKVCIYTCGYSVDCIFWGRKTLRQLCVGTCCSWCLDVNGGTKFKTTLS